IRAYGADDAGAADHLRKNRSQRRSRGGSQAAGESPVFDSCAFPAAHQRPAAEAHSCRVLAVDTELVALIEVRKPALRAQVQPILSDDRGALAAEQRIVDRLRIGVLK